MDEQDIENQERIRGDQTYEMTTQSALDSGQVRWQLDPEDIITKFTADMLRCSIDKKGSLIPITSPQRVMEKDAEGNNIIVIKNIPLHPLINQLGLNDIKILISPFLSKNMYLSEYDKFDIASKVKLTMLTLIGMLYVNHYKYELDLNDADTVVSICFNYMIDAAKRSEDGGERKFITTTTKNIEHKLTSNKPQEQQKKGWFNIMGGR